MFLKSRLATFIFAKMKSTVLQNEKYIFGEGEKGVCGGGQKK